MDFTLIVTAAIAAAIIVIVIALVAVIVFQRWRLGEKNAALGRFIRENIELTDELSNNNK